MNFDKETLIEIEDYIQALDEKVGLKVETIQDIAQAITKQRGLVKKLTIPDVVCSYLVLDETNKVVAEKATEKEVKLYIKHKPNLRYQKFELEENNVACDLDDIL
jgi:hypothetical protein